MRALALGLVLAGCVEQAPQRFVLDGEDVVVAPDSLIVPTATHPELAEVSRDDLVAGIQGGGFVRRIAGVELVDGRYVLATEDVPLGEAVGDAESAKRLAENGKADGSSRDFALAFTVENVRLHDAGGVTIAVERGRLAFRPTLDLDLEVSHGRLEHFLIKAGGTLDGELALAVSAPAAGSWNVARPTWRDTQTFVQWIGWVPVVEVVELTAGIGVDVRSDGAFDARVSAGFTSQLGAGVEYEGGSWQRIGNASLQRRGGVPSVNAAGVVAIHAYVFADVHVRMYGVAGPYVKVRPNLRFRRESDGSWTRTVGIVGDGGAELANPFGEELRYDARLFDVNYPL